MKKIRLSNVQVIICARAEFIELGKTYDLLEETKKHLDEMQMLYLSHREEQEKDKDILLVMEVDDTKTLIENIVRVLNSHQLNDAVGAAEDGNILSEEETDHMAFQFAGDIHILLEALM